MIDFNKFDPFDAEAARSAAEWAVILAIDVLRLIAERFPNDPTLNDGGYKLRAADVIRKFSNHERLAIPEQFREAFRRQPEPQQM